MAAEQEQTVKCFNPECTKEFIVFIPPAEVINSMTLSLVCWAHPNIQTCPHCGTPYQMSVRRLQGVELAWAPVRTKRDAGIVVPPAGFHIPKPS
jgi:hypothetical protein